MKQFTTSHTLLIFSHRHVLDANVSLFLMIFLERELHAAANFLLMLVVASHSLCGDRFFTARLLKAPTRSVNLHKIKGWGPAAHQNASKILLSDVGFWRAVLQQHLKY